MKFLCIFGLIASATGVSLSFIMMDKTHEGLWFLPFMLSLIIFVICWIKLIQISGEEIRRRNRHRGW